MDRPDRAAAGRGDRCLFRPRGGQGRHRRPRHAGRRRGAHRGRSLGGAGVQPALLQGAIENISQGLSVVDQSLRLVAGISATWSCSTIPTALIQVGRPLPRSSATTPCAGSVARAIPTSTWHAGWSGCARAFPTPRSGPFQWPGDRADRQPHARSGFVMSFTDLHRLPRGRTRLREANGASSSVSRKRTRELSQLNQALEEAKLTPKRPTSPESFSHRGQP